MILQDRYDLHKMSGGGSEVSSSPIDQIRRLKTIECGEEAAKHFSFDKGLRNLNHGSFGTYPLDIRPIVHYYQDQVERHPDTYIRFEYPRYLDESRKAIAKYVKASVEACVFVNNATTGLHTVLMNLTYKPGDVIVYFGTVYGAVEKLVAYITETTPAESKKIDYPYTISDDHLCDLFEKTVRDLRQEGRNPVLAIYDTISSQPGVRMPFERLTKLCKKHQLRSCIDAAHSVGHIALNLTELDPDFFVSNCHKWLYTPRGCALFCVPKRNQHLMRSTVPTSHGFEPRTGDIINPLPPSEKGPFVTNFEFVGTHDDTPFLTVPAAIEWRSKITWNGKTGEEAIEGYMKHLARRAGEIVSSILKTEVLENRERTLGNCAFANVRLPLSFAEVCGSDPSKTAEIGHWIANTTDQDYCAYVPLRFYHGAWWTRLSAQIYLTEKDFEFCGHMLNEICERVKRGEWKKGDPKSKL